MEQVTRSPIDGAILERRPLATHQDLDRTLAAAAKAQAAWRATPLEVRCRLLASAVDRVVAEAPAIAQELTHQVGRPIRFSPGEVRGFEDRARTLLRLAPEALAPVVPPAKTGFRRHIQREPVGVVLALAAWNYPYLIAVNVVVPALAAGNAVVLKHSDQTPGCPERLVRCFEEAGLPAGLFSALHATHDRVAEAIADPRVASVAFTGSTAGGRAVHAAAAGRFKPVGLELGGNDAAYVRPDADLAWTAAEVAEGAFFNSGQSCCAIERLYVHRDVASPFLEALVEAARGWKLGDPRDPETLLGPVIRPSAAARLAEVQQQAVAAGGRALLDPGAHPLHGTGAYVAPQIVLEPPSDSLLMAEETFGPLLGVQVVDSDEEAVLRINADRYGLTASLWTRDLDAAEALGQRLEVGTVFANRCDYLDPELAWVGIKDSGRGVTLSRLGFEPFTRPRSFHLRER
jgi:acyl-CoA reductase-like NAD-dependent aldehyde dehydrogenase